MRVQLHTPDGIFKVDTETITNEKLAGFNIKRENLPKPPRNLEVELEKLKDRVEKIEKEKEK